MSNNVRVRFVDGPNPGERDVTASTDGRLPQSINDAGGYYWLYSSNLFSEGLYTYDNPTYRWSPPV